MAKASSGHGRGGGGRITGLGHSVVVVEEGRQGPGEDDWYQIFRDCVL